MRNIMSCKLMNTVSILRFLLFSVALMVALFMGSSCNPESLKDDADDFVGTYNASVVENVRWGSDSGSLTSTGTFFISKVSATRVKASGYINTYGEVNGKTIYFESMTNTGSDGTITTVFQQGIMNGSVLTFSTTSGGQLKYNGKMYPYSATSSWTCIRQQ